jgi:hypothetical protein
LAKARKVKGLKCGESVRVNARKIIDVRLDEMQSWAPYVEDPANIEQIHNLRIAAKRLRYTLEMFSFAFPHRLNDLIKEVRGIQEAIGEMRDADVMIEMVRTTLAAQAAQREARLYEIATATGRGSAAQRRARLRSAQSVAPMARNELALFTLVALKSDESTAHYQRFVTHWRTMQATDFAGRLRRFVGIEAEAGEPPETGDTVSSEPAVDVLVAQDEPVDALTPVPGEASTGA